MLRRYLLIFLSLTLFFPSISFAAIKDGQKCSKVGTTVKYNKVTFACVKINKKLVWKSLQEPKPKAAPAPTLTPSPTLSSSPTPSSMPNPTISSTPASTPTPTKFEKLIISPVPLGNFNTTFMLGKPQSRDIGQSLFFDSEEVLTRLDFQVLMFTIISAEYHSATEEQKHSIEKAAFKGDYKPTPAKINVSLWRDDNKVLSSLPNTFDLNKGFTRIKEFDVTTIISLGEITSIQFPESILVKPGYYYLNLYFVVDDLNITTLRFSGRQTGNNTMGGPNKDKPTDCKYTPSTDLYPKGQAYFSYQDNNWDKKSPNEKWNYQTPRSYTFKLHDYAKVSECVVIGNYSDILNTGDLFFDIYGK